MSTTAVKTATRRPATAADLTVGATVYRGKGKAARTVTSAWIAPDGAFAVCDVTVNGRTDRYNVQQLTVEIQR